jgi:hypothetical protein
MLIGISGRRYRRRRTTTLLEHRLDSGRRSGSIVNNAEEEN